MTSKNNISADMIHMRVRLLPEEYRSAKREADHLGISVAEFVRRVLQNTLPVDDSAPWMRYAGIVQSGDTKSSRRIDEVVYG